MLKRKASRLRGLLSAAAGGFHRLPQHAHLLDAAAQDGQHLESEAVEANLVANVGHLAQLVKDEAAHRIEVVLFDLDSEELRQLVDAALAVDDYLVIADPL